MRVATWNINDIRKRLPLLLAWLEATLPDVVALQELKCTAEDFPGEDLARLGYRCLVAGQRTWNGVALLCLDRDPIEIRRALPGDPADKQARYVEAAINGVIVASLYLPNGNPVPGPKFDYKLARFERLLNHAHSLIKSGHPVVLAGDYNVVPTDRDIYSPVTWRDNALLQDDAPRLCATAQARLDRCDRQETSGTACVHVLGLPPQPLAAGRGTSN
jgi:exodeoxyribonuclease III